MKYLPSSIRHWCLLILASIIPTVATAQTRIYSEAYISYQQDDDVVPILGLNTGLMFTDVVGLGIGTEYMSVLFTNDRYLSFQGQLRGTFNPPAHNFYYSLTMGRGSLLTDAYQKNEGYYGRLTKGELLLGVRVAPFITFAGGYSLWRTVFWREGVYQGNAFTDLIREETSHSLTVRLQVTYDPTHFEKWGMGRLYGYMIGTPVAFSLVRYPNRMRRYTIPEWGVFLGGGYRLQPNLGIGIGINVMGHVADVSPAYTNRAFQGVGVHVTGLWPQLTALAEIGFAPYVVEGNFSTRDAFNFYPTTRLTSSKRNGQAPYLRFALGPRLGRIATLQVGTILYPPVRGTGDFLTYDSPTGQYISDRQELRRGFYSFQLGIGFLVAPELH